MSCLPYPQYKDSGIEWLGAIPSHWKLIRIKNLLAQRVTDGPHLTPEFIDDGIPFLSVDGIQDGELVFEKCRFVSPRDHQEFRKKAKPARNDILLGKAASTGKIARVKVDFEFSIWSPLALLKIAQERYDPAFIEYALKSPALQAQIDVLCTSNTQKNISMDDIPRLALAAPLLPEQRAIAAFLDRETARIDALIAKQEQMIALLQEKRKAMISHAVTRGLCPDVPLKDSGVEWLGMVPEHWEVKRLKFIADVRTGVAKGRELAGKDLINLPYLRVANVQDGYLDLSDVATIDLGRDEQDRYLLRPGDVLMNEGGDYDKLGRGYVWQGEIEPCVHQNHVFSVRPHDIENAFWINLVTQTSYAKQYFISRSKQSTNLASISSSNIQEWPVVMPPYVERQTILKSVQNETTKIDTLMNKAHTAIGLLKEHRTSLISAAVTGKIDVRGL